MRSTFAARPCWKFQGQHLLSKNCPSAFCLWASGKNRQRSWISCLSFNSRGQFVYRRYVKLKFQTWLYNLLSLVLETWQDHSGLAFQHATNRTPCSTIIFLTGKKSNSSCSLTRHQNNIISVKLLNQIIYTKKSSHKMKLVQSSRCSFCKNSDESLERLFCHCCFRTAFCNNNRLKAHDGSGSLSFALNDKLLT